MRTFTKAILAAVATVALAGGATAAERATHVLKVVLPDGSVEHIRYAGDFRPQIAVVPVRAEAAPAPMRIALFPNFAAMDRMFAAMDAQTDAMMRQAAMLSRMPAMATGAPTLAGFVKLPAGTVRYSYTSTTSSNGCTQTVQMRSTAGQQQPQVTRASYGSCGTPAAAAPKAVLASASTRPKPAAPGTI